MTSVTNYAGLASGETIGTLFQWSNVNNAEGAPDGNNATVTTANGTSHPLSNFLITGNYGFSIPSGSVINGVVVGITRSEPSGGNIALDKVVALCQGSSSSLISSNVASSTKYPQTATIQTYGSSTDTLGATLTSDIINNSNFGVAFQPLLSVSGIDTIDVDAISIEIFYTVPPTPTPTVTPTTSVTSSLTVTPSPTVTATPSVTATSSLTPTPTSTITPTVTPTISVTPSTTPTPTVTPSTTPALEDELTDGFVVEIETGTGVIFANPSTTLCSGTWILPENPADEAIIEILTSKQISVLTLSPNSGQFITPNPPTLMLAGSGISYRFCATLSTWFRRW